MKKIVYDKSVISEDNLVGWNNKVSFYLDKSTLPISFGGILGLNGFGVLYYIVSENDIIYIGSTMDFGQRIQTHLKESRNCKDSNKKKLYKDIELSGNAIIGILGVYCSSDECKEMEKKTINLYKDFYLKNEFGDKYKFLVSKEEQKSFLFNKFYNIKS